MGQFWGIAPCCNYSFLRLVCFLLLSNRDGGCDRESVRSWGPLLFVIPATRVFLLFVLVYELGDLPVCLLGHHESCCQP